MIEKQQTIQKEVSLKGIGLHTGQEVSLTFKPAEVNAGVQFVRVDLPGKPVIKADPANVRISPEIPRCTSISTGDVVIHTVEHLMSVLCGLGVDNLIVETDGSELPGMDGSATEFLKAIKVAGIIEQAEERQYITLKEPIGVGENGSGIYIMPADNFKISYTLEYEHPALDTQFFSLVVDSNTFEREIAPSRTFCLESEAVQLQEQGLGKGASYSNTLVIGDEGVINNTVNFPNEFARHKVLDFIGDLYLLGKPIRGHVFAVRSGHKLNVELLKKIHSLTVKKQNYPRETVSIPETKELDISSIMKILPHRYPFLLVDRVVGVEQGKRGVGIKNVTINDDFFQGHFPTRPVMPGVLMVEAMAQTAGVIVLTTPVHKDHLAFFMSCDKVKFRKVVSPGDQLFMEIEVLRDRGRIAQVRGVSKVDGEIVAEAEMMFSFTDASYLG